MSDPLDLNDLAPEPDYIAAIPEPQRRRLGRTIRAIVDNALRYYDGSGEATARGAFDALADALDPEQAGVADDVRRLLDEAAS